MRVWLLFFLVGSLILPSEAKPLSGSILDFTRQKEVKESLKEVIDNIFDYEGEIPIVTVRVRKEKEDKNSASVLQGTYNSKKRIIHVAPESPSAGISLILVHELGHWIDYCVLTTALMGKDAAEVIEKEYPASVAIENEHIKPLLAAINNTKAIKELRLEASSFQPTNRYTRVIYLLDNREMFARAFTQYVVLKSKNLRLLGDFERVSKTRQTIYGQWTDEDFLPVYKILDTLLTEAKILKK